MQRADFDSEAGSKGILPSILSRALAQQIAVMVRRGLVVAEAHVPSPNMGEDWPLLCWHRRQGCEFLVESDGRGVFGKDDGGKHEKQGEGEGGGDADGDVTWEVAPESRRLGDTPDDLVIL